MKQLSGRLDGLSVGPVKGKAKAKGLNSKVTEYKKSVKHLIESIAHVMHEYTNMNRIHDLLDEFVTQHL